MLIFNNLLLLLSNAVTLGRDIWVFVYKHTIIVCLNMITLYAKKIVASRFIQVQSDIVLSLHTKYISLYEHIYLYSFYYINSIYEKSYFYDRKILNIFDKITYLFLKKLIINIYSIAKVIPIGHYIRFIFIILCTINGILVEINNLPQNSSGQDCLPNVSNESSSGNNFNQPGGPGGPGGPDYDKVMQSSSNTAKGKEREEDANPSYLYKEVDTLDKEQQDFLTERINKEIGVDNEYRVVGVVEGTNQYKIGIAGSDKYKIVGVESNIKEKLLVKKYLFSDSSEVTDKDRILGSENLRRKRVYDYISEDKETREIAKEKYLLKKRISEYEKEIFNDKEIRAKTDIFLSKGKDPLSKFNNNKSNWVEEYINDRNPRKRLPYISRYAKDPINTQIHNANTHPDWLKRVAVVHRRPEWIDPDGALYDRSMHTLDVIPKYGPWPSSIIGKNKSATELPWLFRINK